MQLKGRGWRKGSEIVSPTLLLHALPHQLSQHRFLKGGEHHSSTLIFHYRFPLSSFFFDYLGCAFLFPLTELNTARRQINGHSHKQLKKKKKRHINTKATTNTSNTAFEKSLDSSFSVLSLLLLFFFLIWVGGNPEGKRTNIKGEIGEKEKENRLNKETRKQTNKQTRNKS